MQEVKGFRIDHQRWCFCSVHASVGLCSSSQVRLVARVKDTNVKHRRCEFYDYLPCHAMACLALNCMNCICLRSTSSMQWAIASHNACNRLFSRYYCSLVQCFMFGAIFWDNRVFYFLFLCHKIKCPINLSSVMLETSNVWFVNYLPSAQFRLWKYQKNILVFFFKLSICVIFSQNLVPNILTIYDHV